MPATTDVGAALDVLLDAALEPIVELVLVRDGDAIEAHAFDGSVRFDRDGKVLDGTRPQSAGRPVHGSFRGIVERARRAAAGSHREQLPVRLRAGRAAVRPPVRARSLRDPHRGAQLGGPGWPSRRARLARRRAGACAVHHRRRGCALVGHARAFGPARRRRAHGARSHGRGAAARHRWGRARRGARCRAGAIRTTSSGSCGTAATRTCCTTRSRNGDAPNVGRLMAMGTTFGHGAMASLPTVTLANHTSVLTGLHPGHHGILHNAWWDRATGRQVITNSPATWHEASSWLFPGVETIHDAVHRTWPDSCTVSINEPTDAGADFSTFDYVRRGDLVGTSSRARRVAERGPTIRPSGQGVPVVESSRPHDGAAVRWRLVGQLPRVGLATSEVHVVQLLVDRRRLPRRRSALRHRTRVDPRHRCSARRDPRRGRALGRVGPTPRSSSWPTTAWRRRIPP